MAILQQVILACAVRFGPGSGRHAPGSAEVRQGGGSRARDHELGLELVGVAAVGGRVQLLALRRHRVLAQRQRAALVRQLQALRRALRAHEIDRHLDARLEVAHLRTPHTTVHHSIRSCVLSRCVQGGGPV